MTIGLKIELLKRKEGELLLTVYKERLQFNKFSELLKELSYKPENREKYCVERKIVDKSRSKLQELEFRITEVRKKISYLTFEENMESFSGISTLRSGKKSQITDTQYKNIKDAIKSVVDMNPGDMENIISKAEILSLREFTFNISDMASGMAYEDFNPKKLATILSQMVNADPSREYDIIVMVAASIKRGNRVSKMDKNSSVVFSKTIKELTQVYGLLDKPNNNGLAITLSRVAAAFPFLACQYMEVAKNMVNTKSEMSVICVNYPRPMMCQHFTSLIPRNSLITQHLIYAHTSSYLYLFPKKISL